MKAIETQYAGCRFRSRREARWAVFFDALGLRWEYEPEGFELSSGRYLPDFRLADIGYFEVKGAEPTEQERAKALDLAKATGETVFIAWGESIPFDTDDHGYGPGEGSAAFVNDIEAYFAEGGGDYQYAWCTCPWCGKVGLSFEGRGARICGYRSHFDTEEEAAANADMTKHWRVDDKMYTADDERLQEAYRRARSARFEFGESPGT